MNTLTHNGESFDFETVAELLALPRVNKFRCDPAVSHFSQGNGQLLAFKLIDGTLATPVILPQSITGLPLRK